MPSHTDWFNFKIGAKVESSNFHLPKRTVEDAGPYKNN